MFLELADSAWVSIGESWRGGGSRKWVGLEILFQSNGKSLEGSKQENDVILFAFLKNLSGCCVKMGRRGVSWR